MVWNGTGYGTYLVEQFSIRQRYSGCSPHHPMLDNPIGDKFLAPYCFWLRGSIFFAIVLLFIGKRRQFSRADSAGPEIQNMLARKLPPLHFFACS
jgi:hypothetical protein